ncbi:DJ-1/PfpI family protein [Streptomyces sp. NPDC048416]|uniref:DJ-1/PfpI family protein n=1 Tax=Streptomyces sp. NPDC048416 TaxID=3365546 RepID=UPI003715DCAC
MLIAVVLYPGFTALDAVGPYEALSRLPGAESVFVAEQAGPVRNDNGSLSLVAEKPFAHVLRPDIVVVPGGPPGAVEPHLRGGPLLDWLRTADVASTWTASVGTGSLLLGAAGLLKGRRATSHWLALDQLAAFGVSASEQRVVVDRKYVTAAGVSAGIDMGLTLLGAIAGDRYAQAVQLLMAYDPQPPYDAGSPHKAPADLVEQFRSNGFPRD